MLGPLVAVVVAVFFFFRSRVARCLGLSSFQFGVLHAGWVRWFCVLLRVIFCPVIPIFPQFLNAFNLIWLNLNCTQLPKYFCSGLWPYNWCLVSIKSLRDSVAKPSLLTRWTRIKTKNFRKSSVVIASHASPPLCQLRHGCLHTLSSLHVLTKVALIQSIHLRTRDSVIWASGCHAAGRSWVRLRPGQHSGSLK